MKLFDSHCHLNDRCYAGDLEAVLDQAREAGVHGFMVIGIDPKSSRKAAEIAASHEDAWASVGVHPHDTKRCSEEALAELRALAGENSRVRAWGEIGLDFNRMHSPRADQEKWFERQMAEAANLNLPLIFHERDSEGRFADMLQNLLPEDHPGVVHCFSGNKKELRTYLDRGLYIGITGIITISRRGAPLREMISYIPDDRLLVETDAPFLTPAPEKNRVRRNEPALVKSVFLKLAEVKKAEPEALAPVVWENTCRLFDIG